MPDLLHEYGIDLRDLLLEDSPLDPKWVLIHVWNLPIASSFMAIQRGGLNFRGWDQAQYDSASLIDAINDVAYILIMANRDPSKPAPKPPARYKRPNDPTAPENLPDDQKTSFKPGSFGDMLQKAKRNKRARLAREAQQKAE